MSYAGPSGRKSQGRQAIKPVGQRRPSPSSDHNVAFLVGVIVGATVGAGVALLLAPHSGRATRRRLLRQGRRVTRRGRDAWQDLADEFRDAIERRREDRETRASDGPANAGQRKSFSLRAASSL